MRPYAESTDALPAAEKYKAALYHGKALLGTAHLPAETKFSPNLVSDQKEIIARASIILHTGSFRGYSEETGKDFRRQYETADSKR